MALAIACLAMILINKRWGGRLLLLLLVALLIGLPFIPTSLFDLIGDVLTVEALGGVATLSNFRLDVWTQAYAGLQDFPFTGMGFGTFRALLFLLYPTRISPSYNVGHAHNFFLQTGLDFGLPGLIAMIAFT